MLIFLFFLNRDKKKNHIDLFHCAVLNEKIIIAAGGFFFSTAENKTAGSTWMELR